MALLETLVDTFDGTTDTNIGAPWGPAGNPYPTYQSGRCRIFCNYNLCRIVSTATYDATDSQIVWEWSLELDSGTNPNVNVWMECRMTTGSAGTRARATWTSAGVKTLDMRSWTSGTPTSITFDPVAHRWMRIRETATTCYVDTAPDGVTWTNRFSDTVNGTVTNRQVQFCTDGAGGTSTAKAFIDNVNAAPSGIAVAGSASGTATASASLTVTPSGTGALNAWNGTAWVPGVLKVWNGSTWVAGTLRVWSGGQWLP